MYMSADKPVSEIKWNMGGRDEWSFELIDLSSVLLLGYVMKWVN